MSGGLRVKRQILQWLVTQALLGNLDQLPSTRDLAIPLVDVAIQNLFELWNYFVSSQSHGKTPINIDRGFRLFGSAGERNSNVGVLRFAGAVHDAAHHRDLQLLHS